MPVLRGGEWVYQEGEQQYADKKADVRAEDKPGHRPLNSYSLPKWVYHPDQPKRRIYVEREDYFGMAADGSRNYENWNVAHVAAVHDDLKLLSLASPDQCKEMNKWGMTPAHMCGLGQHAYGPSLNVLYELVQMGAADPEALNLGDQTPWHVAQRMHKAQNLKKFEKVLLKGHKPDMYDEKFEAELKPRGKFAHALGMQARGIEGGTLPVCVVFPGQGSQYMGMMKELKDLDIVKEMLAKAKDILGYDVLELCLNGPEEKLSQTKYCQPAMYIAGLAALEKLRMDEPDKVSKCMATAGLSLGEYTALAFAEVFTFEEGLKLVKLRAEAMEQATSSPAQAMLSVAGLSREVVEDLCKELAVGGQVCQIANFLFPKGFSVAGSKPAVEALEKKAQDAGALQAKLLKTSGAFHTPIMQPARDSLEKALSAALPNMKSPKLSVYMNVTAKPIGPDTPPADIVKMLGEQLTNPVQWEQCMKEMIKDGGEFFYECGPSKQLKAMMKRIEPKAVEKMTNILA